MMMVGSRSLRACTFPCRLVSPPRLSRQHISTHSRVSRGPISLLSFLANRQVSSSMEFADHDPSALSSSECDRHSSYIPRIENSTRHSVQYATGDCAFSYCSFPEHFADVNLVGLGTACSSSRGVVKNTPLGSTSSLLPDSGLTNGHFGLEEWSHEQSFETFEPVSVWGCSHYLDTFTTMSLASSSQFEGHTTTGFYSPPGSVRVLNHSILLL